MSSFDPEKWQKTLLTVIGKAHAERLRQLKKWGPQHHDMHKWMTVLMEEVGELAKETLSDDCGRITSKEALQAEAIQVAAVALAIVQYTMDGIS